MPIDIPSYDERVLRELLANAICHQDYTKQGRIGIQEFPTYLIIQNSGNFFSGSIEQVVEQEDFMPSSYRNPCLKDIMSEVKMIEYAGSGLRKVFISQKSRYMPMPSDLSTKDIVKIRIDGKIINENYAKLLYNNTEISLIDIIDLDKIQKGQSLSKEKMKSLKQK
jgi:ATP-dependent DNA helicase RecG